MSALDPTYPAFTYGSGDTSASGTAGEAISAKRVVKLFNGLMYLADATNLADVGKVVGITLNAGSAGDSITYQYSSTIDDTAWTWVEGPIYLGSAGQLTQSLVGLTFLQQIGIAIGETEMLIDIEPAIILN